MRLDRIRNFSIIAHIDHGKSTLADRLLEATGTVALRDMQDQVLDQLDLERERGITIKAQAVRLAYTASDGITYELNLIDTPGHVDFAYEVSRSLAACEGALLVVDATQGVEAQTLANVYQALENHLEIIPVINKIDLANADPELVRREIEEVIGIPADGAILTSARQGIGIDLVLEAIVKQVPPPTGDPDGPLRALIFDAKYDAYRGVVVYVRIVDGHIAGGMRIRMMNNRSEFVVDEVGVFAPAMSPVGELACGEVGYFIASIKNVRDSKVGDTVTDAAHPTTHPLPGYRAVTPMVYAGIFPVDSDDVTDLKEALQRLNLNDASLIFEPEVVSGARIRVSLRLPGPAAHGDRAGAPGAGVQPFADHHRADCRVPSPTSIRRGDRDRQPGDAARRVEHRGDRGTTDEGDDHRAEHVRGRDHGAVPGAPRGVPAHGLPAG